jgi:hypothetical protein
MAHSYAELRRRLKEDLVQEYDRLTGSTQVGLNFYLEEIARREVEEQSQRMLTMTEAMRSMTTDIRKWTQVMMWLTIVMTVLTVVNIVF